LCCGQALIKRKTRLWIAYKNELDNPENVSDNADIAGYCSTF